MEQKLAFIHFAIDQTIQEPQTIYWLTATSFEPSTVSTAERAWESVSLWNGVYDNATGDGVAVFEFETNAPWVAEGEQQTSFFLRKAAGLEWIPYNDSAGGRWIGGTDLTPAGVAPSTRDFLDIDQYLAIVRESLRSVETISPNPNGSMWIAELDVSQIHSLVRSPVGAETADLAPVRIFVDLDDNGMVRRLSFQPANWWKTSGFATSENEELWVEVRVDISSEDLSTPPCAAPTREVLDNYGEVATCAAQ